MTKTPDETKKGLECCSTPRNEEPCRQCPYAPNNGYCVDKMSRDAFYLIQQLQAENTEKDARIWQLEKRVIHLEALNQSDLTTITMQERTRARLQERISQLEAERDAAVADMKNSRDCQYCKHYGVKWDEPCVHCDHENNCFEWRGIQKEE